MRPRTAGLALLAGLATFVVVGVGATELVAPQVEFSLFVGIPVGLLAGVAAAALVFARLEDPSPGRRRPANAVAGFGVGFVVAVLLGAGVLGMRYSIAIPAAAVVGVLAAAVAAALERGGTSTRT